MTGSQRINTWTSARPLWSAPPCAFFCDKRDHLPVWRGLSRSPHNLSWSSFAICARSIAPFSSTISSKCMCPRLIPRLYGRSHSILAHDVAIKVQSPEVVILELPNISNPCFNTHRAGGRAARCVGCLDYVVSETLKHLGGHDGLACDLDCLAGVLGLRPISVRRVPYVPSFTTPGMITSPPRQGPWICGPCLRIQHGLDVACVSARIGGNCFDQVSLFMFSLSWDVAGLAGMVDVAKVRPTPVKGDRVDFPRPGRSRKRRDIGCAIQ